ncbi:tRNA lysidine(34) synthetase TilS [Caulobacter mirabilis]|uniref:tRNA(Ile)-lysidine synthase n=1 Tax=Caulobacter mirabilis TaxID=69666 RepID=A0A2D2ATR7_9CAUL|nr:tRNA lysidine(34) synthetase TilS [Caulobacter mirabilis]ATQ41404.1 tRNA lysidine(34) synthetase TilS [Caulobacter mirabilis]
MRGLDLPALDRRLRRSCAAPLAVAFSGGGDSLALLLAARAWADAHGRRLLVLTVDHGLNPDSTAWTERCALTAERLGLAFRALRWERDKPATGLPAAARAARHALLAEAAREAGARVVLMGHTADDLREAAAMRDEGSTVGDPAEWSPSPVWPAGRGVFLLRPLLAQGRAELRDWLRERGETWIDDPANADVRYARARARLQAPSPPTAPSAAIAPPVYATLAGGALRLERSAASAHVAAACLCAAGTSRPPRGDRLARLVERLRSTDAFTATLAGARVEALDDQVLFTREAGEAARGGLAPIRLVPGETAVWDGRFELTAATAALTVRPLAGLAAGLPAAEQEALRSVPAAARPALPAIIGPEGPSCPILAALPPVRVHALVSPRFEAATGAVDIEPAV